MFRRAAGRQGLWGLLVGSLRAWPGPWGGYAAGVLVVSACQGCTAWAVAEVVQAVASGRPLQGLGPAAWGVAAAGLKVVAGALVAGGEVSLTRRLGEELRDSALRALLAGHRRQGVGDVFRILGAVREVEQAAMAGGLGGLRALGALLPLAGAVVALVPGAVLAGACLVLPFGLALARLRRAALRDEQQALDLTARLEQQLDALVRHAELWRVAGSGRVARGWVRELGERARRAAVGARARRAALSASNEALAALGVVVLLLAASSGWLPGASLVVFATLLALAYRPVRDWGDAQGAWMAGEVALRGLAPWLGQDDEPPGPAARAWPLAPLVAEGFGALWHPRRWSFTLEPGALVAITGPNGSGKSTLLRALLGLEPSAGRLRYGGVELTERGVGPGERPLAWCPQEAPLLATSLEGNLALGGPGRLDEARELLGEGWGPEGVGEESLGEGGRALSGGERAWVSLARACVAGQPVLLLDEPTASLDAEAERRFLGLLERLRGRRTVLVITHRPEALRGVDRVLRSTDAPEAQGQES